MYSRSYANRGRTLDDFGWASVQLDGGIDKVLTKISDYFQQAKARPMSPPSQRNLAVAFLSEANEEIPDALAVSVAEIMQGVVGAGGTAVLPSDSRLASAQPLLAALGLTAEPKPSLAYGQLVDAPGFHLMERPTTHWTETVTGLAATGVDLIVAFTSRPRPGHPFVPLLLVNHAAYDEPLQRHVDLTLQGDNADWTEQILATMAAIVAGQQQPRTWLDNHIDFQLTRGWLGIST